MLKSIAHSTTYILEVLIIESFLLLLVSSGYLFSATNVWLSMVAGLIYILKIRTNALRLNITEIISL